MVYKINSSISINEMIKKLKYGDTLFLEKGIYNEKVEIYSDGITLIGEDVNETIISNMDYYHKIMDDNNECNTFRTYTVYTGGKDITIKNLTIENRAIPSKIYGQAVALHVNCDNFVCENCILKGAQDTLFTGPLPPDLIIRHKNFLPKVQLINKSLKQLYNKCTIMGDVDFIFGGATALFNECNIVCIDREASTSNIGFICAPSHLECDKFGYLFYKCNLQTLNKNIKMYLARPWRDYGTAAFILCNLDTGIHEEGFNKWNNTSRDKTARFYEYSLNIDLSKRVSWAKQFNKDEALKYYNEFLAYFKS